MKSPELIQKMATRYIRKKDATLESIAKEFGVSQTTVHNYFTIDLEKISPSLYQQVCDKKQKNLMKSHQDFVKRMAKKREGCFMCKFKKFISRK